MKQSNSECYQLYPESFWYSLGKYDPKTEEAFDLFTRKGSYADVTKQGKLLTFRAESPSRKYGFKKEVDTSLVPESYVSEFLSNTKGEGSNFDNLEMTISISEQEEIWLVFEAKN